MEAIIKNSRLSIQNKKEEYKGYTITTNYENGDWYFVISKGSKKVFQSGPSYNSSSDAMEEGKSKVDSLK